MDDRETPEQTARRELEEETGYVADGVIEVSPLLAADPGAEYLYTSPDS
jgi:ADP-ribose pyrophosphatase